MILKAQGKEIEFFEWDHSSHKKFMLALSSGTDSAMYLYLACLAIPEKQIICHTGVDRGWGKDPYIGDYAREIVDFMRKKFPHVDIVHEVYDFNSQLLEHIQQARKEIDEAEDKSLFPTVYGHAKGVATRAIKREIKQRYECTLSGHGITKNPPIELPHAEPRRNREYEPMVVLKSGNVQYRPFVNVDKKFIAELYEQYDLMDDLFPMTASCIGNNEDTKFHTEPCRTCFWCHEKLWAFGCYDGGIK